MDNELGDDRRDKPERPIQELRNPDRGIQQLT